MPAISSALPRRLPLAALGLVAVLAVFGWGVIHLFELRFAGGDVYPAYSTLRKDPLGSAAFYDALASLPGLSVERNLRPLTSLALPSGLRLGPLATPDPGGTANSSGPLVCFYLGADAYEWPRLFRHNEFERLDAILHQGGRVVLTFLPGQTPLTEKRLARFRHDELDDDPGPTPVPQGQTPHGTPVPPPTPPAKNPAKRERLANLRWEDLVERWGIDFRRTSKPPVSPALSHGAHGDQQDLAQPVATGPADGAAAVSWHSVLDFDLDTPGARAAGWHALYQRGDRPVVVARPVGNQGGELILASDSYFLSNEALRAEPRPALLAALVGPARRVVFDETHLGIAEQPGMMTLARRYHLQGALGALGLLAVLFIWRNVVSLVPPPVPASGAAQEATVTGRDAAAGFLNLLRRGVSPRELIAVCLAQWQQFPGPRAPDAAAIERLRVLAEAEAARPINRRSPATAYRAMCAATQRIYNPK